MLAFSAGIIILSCAFTLEERVPKNVTVNGVQVGGETLREAALKVRAESEKAVREKNLTVVSDNSSYSFKYPEIYYKDNVYSLIKSAKKGDVITAETHYYLCGADEIAAGICLSETQNRVEPYAKFSKYGEPFTFFEGRDGKIADKGKLLKDISSSLNGGGETVRVSFTAQKRQKSLQDIKLCHVLLSSFTTYYDGANLNRASNIRLSAAKLNGAVIEAGKTLSFNDTVGERVKERGFLPAKIIVGGEFTDGVGGGVCQVSTTLYNCALLAGLQIEEYHPHSLAVGYVAPSRDAMVSGKYFDLKIKNTYKTPVYIRAKTFSGGVTFSIYGKSDGADYSLESVVSGSVAAPEETTDNPAAARDGKDGVISESYLKVRRGSFVRRVLLRKDKYAPVKKIIYKEQNPEDTQNTDGPQQSDGGQ